MKKQLVILLALTLFSCKKESVDPQGVTATPTVSLTDQLAAAAAGVVSEQRTFIIVTGAANVTQQIVDDVKGARFTASKGVYVSDVGDVQNGNYSQFVIGKPEANQILMTITPSVNFKFNRDAQKEFTFKAK